MRTTLPKLVSVLALVAATASAPLAARPASPASAGPALSSIGTLAFAADGTLFAADPQAATIFALTLGAQPSTAGTKDVPALDQKIAAMLGTEPNQIAIRDLAVHPQTHNSFVSVMRGQGAAAQPALVRIDGAGKIEAVSLETVKFTSVTLPNPPAATTTGRNNRSQSITHMALVDGSLYVTGLSNEEFASKFWAIPYPFKSADQGASVEIWHTSHNRFETNAPILAFVPTKVNGTTTFIAGYTCTPLVRFPVTDLKPGSKVMGTTIAELGAGNQPIDMIMYKKDGHDFVLMANTKHGILKIAAAGFGTAPGLKEQVPTKAGIPGESITSMPNVVQLDLLDATHSVTLSRDGAGAPINLVTTILP
jgi:hypothetical protein